MVDPARFGITNPAEPAVHDLAPFRFGDISVAVRVVIRKSDDGAWRGRLLFGPGAPEDAVKTAEIFFAPTEADLWTDIHNLRTHHFQDLYRSLTE